MSALTIDNHDRDRAGLTYVYPVLSRRSGGLSVGINLNPNNACNWRCIYCQVPGLTRGSAPVTDIPLLERELKTFLTSVIDGDFYEKFQVPEAQRSIRDIAISGNGEPTSSPVFDQVITAIGRVCMALQPGADVARVLITNGSLISRAAVRLGLAEWGKQGGEIWFKIDSATQSGVRAINDVTLSTNTILGNLAIAADCCSVWIQTCLFNRSDEKIDRNREKQAYVELLQSALDKGVKLQGVLLYGPARPAMQPECAIITPLASDAILAFAEAVREGTGLTVKITP
ncbi:radical SAM protein [Candidatus Methylospira mobilis]|uniref:Radical SAM protein n=1 Tax=Candidatus Methylospira mobilis TaxID=1808979 RepID=A0A5Q0BMT1_9GAMM|nr:radical SAM protein [Candidatus Methylospira mobilis]QFY44452.1 radical SAM protein [Candidatus Methylospira mobilis]